MDKQLRRAILQDQNAGTPGNWRFEVNGIGACVVLVGNDAAYDGEAHLCHIRPHLSGNQAIADGFRIARVPELESAVLGFNVKMVEQEALAKQEALAMALGIAQGVMSSCPPDRIGAYRDGFGDAYREIRNRLMALKDAATHPTQ